MGLPQRMTPLLWIIAYLLAEFVGVLMLAHTIGWT
jgi:hypothetical protein